ncbi:hypothetical protein BGZ93_003672 [Podila epicladia]|nr:hypothetical protein BGZ92_003023 [Podila epicladia]KAG0096992.1 hypothetical protein BGZ93_003672 [Podila epicladia]
MDHATVAITMEKDKSISTNAKQSQRERVAVQRALGFKNVVIYVLVFLNLVLCAKLYSIWSRATPSHPTGKHGSDAVWATRLAREEEPEHEGGDASTPDFWIKMALIVFLVMIGGVFAGLTIGLMGLDETNLHVLMASGTPVEQVHAETVYKLLSRGKHWVLVTLLLGNVIVNETLPVVLDSELGGGVVAILISTLLIVVFGEIIPQAVCARYGLAIGSYCAKPMLVLMYLMSPVAYPIAMLLDYWLGVHHGTTYRRTELKTLVSLHQVDGIGELTDDEVTIIASVLDLKEKPVSSVMTPLEDVFTLSEDAILDEQLMEEIVSAGYSRIPIYRHDDANNFIGMLLVKRLITYDPEDHIPVRKFTINSLPEAAPNTSCLDILNFFQEGRSHMAIVTSDPGGFGLPVGIITLEDVIEELLGEEIVDESDVYVDIHNKIRVIRKPSRNVSMIKNLKSLLQSPAISDAATPLLGNASSRKATMLPDNTYMSTGKTILQPQQSSVGGVHSNIERRKSHSSIKSHRRVSEHTAEQDRIDPAEQTKHSAQAVNFKDDVDIIKETINKQDKGTNGCAVEPEVTAVTIEMPEPGETYPITAPNDELAAAAVAAAAQATHTTDLPKEEVETAPEPKLAETAPEPKIEKSTTTPTPAPIIAQEVVSEPVDEPSSSASGIASSESNATLLSAPTSTDAGASPASTSSKKKKNKKKKSTK